MNDELALENIVDVFQEGKIIVSWNGFGLLSKKKLSWFSLNGEFLGEVLAKHPIRTFYWVANTLIVETRQHRAEIQVI